MAMGLITRPFSGTCCTTLSVSGCSSFVRAKDIASKTNPLLPRFSAAKTPSPTTTGGTTIAPAR